MRIMNVVIICLAGMYGGALAQDQPVVEAKVPSFKIETAAYYQLPNIADSLVIAEVSDDRNHAAILLYHEDRKAVYFRRTFSRYYDGILAITLSPDAGHIAIVARNRKKYIAVVDGEEIENDYRDFGEAIRFSPNGEHYLYSALKKKSFSEVVEVVVDGRKKEYDGFMTPVPDYFSPAGDHVVYIARKGKKSFVVLDGEPGNEYLHTSVGPYFSPDGASLAYAGYRNDTAYMVINNEEHGGYSEIRQFAFSPDSRHHAYTAKKNYDAYLVFDHNPIGPYQDAWDPVFSAGGNHFGYVARQSDSFFVVIDSIERPRFNDAAILTFSPDENHFAYVAYISSDSLNKRVAVVCDDTLQKIYYNIDVTSLMFSENSEHFGYIALVDSETTVAVIDGIESKGYLDITFLSFSPDGEEFAYIARMDKDKMFMVHDGREGRTFESVGIPVFSSDGDYLAYSAYEDGKYYTVINDETLPGFDYMLPLTPEFDDAGRLKYFVMNGKTEVLQVTVYPVTSID